MSDKIEYHKSRKKTTLWRLLDLYVNLIIGLVKGVFIIPLYLIYIDNTLFGAWLVTGNILMWLTLFDPGVGDVAVQKVAVSYKNGDFESIKYQISSSIFISFFISFLVGILGVVFAHNILALVTIPKNLDYNQLHKAFIIAVAGTACTLFSYSLSGSILGLQRTKGSGIMRIIIGVLSILITIYLLTQGYQIMAIAISTLITSFLFVIIYSFILIKIVKEEKIGFGFRLSYLKQYSRIFTFTFVSKIFSTVTQNIDLLLVSKYVSLDNVYVLEICRRPLRVLQGFVNSPSVAMLPTIASLFGEGDLEKLKFIIKRMTILLTILLIFISFGFITFNKGLISLWIGEKYYIGDSLNLFIALSFLTLTFSYNLSNFTYSLGRIKENSIFSVVKNIFSIAILFILAKYYHLAGIILSPLISSLLTEVWYFPFLLLKDIKYKLSEITSMVKEILFVLSLSIVLSFLFTYFSKTYNWYTFVLTVVIYTLISTFGFYYFSETFRSEFKQVLKKLTRRK